MVLSTLQWELSAVMREPFLDLQPEHLCKVRVGYQHPACEPPNGAALGSGTEAVEME